MKGYAGEIRMFGGSHIPDNWKLCDGSTVPLASYTTLYLRIGTTFGGDGHTTIGLPDLLGRVALHPNGSTYLLGSKGGEANVKLTIQQMPVHDHTGADHAHDIPGHNHIVRAQNTDLGGNTEPGSHYPAQSATGNIYGGKYDVTMNEKMIKPTDISKTGLSGELACADAGGNDAHNNMQPYCAVNYIICVTDN